MQKTNSGRVWASGEGAEAVCCWWKSSAGHRGSESLQVTSVSKDPLFFFISAVEENSFKAFSFLSFSPLYRQRIQDMEEELQKTERSYKNQVNFLLPGYCITFYCIFPMLRSELLEVLGVAQNKPYHLSSQIAAHEKKAHDNWVRTFFLFQPRQLIFDSRLVQLMQLAELFLTAYCPLCRESSGWRKERSCQPEAKVSTVQTTVTALWTCCLLLRREGAPTVWGAQAACLLTVGNESLSYYF